jgi:hypothetical protein
MSKPTPGPWQIDDEGAIFSHGALVATVNVRQYPNSNVWDWDTAGADGALIAAAPDLLAALNAMLTHMGMDEDEWNKPTFDQARRAIAKATGEQP